MLLASRGPFPVDFLREHGAVGAVSACIRLGEAMIAAEGEGGEAMITAITETLGGRELGRGPLRSANVARARELGRRHARGRQRLAARRSTSATSTWPPTSTAKRVATYPDLIVTLAESDGMPTPAAHREPGERIVVLAVPRDKIPLGAGVREAAVYRDPERLLGIELVAHAGAS